MRIARLSDQAKEDLVEIWEFIAQENPTAADRLLQKLVTQYKSLAGNPGMGRLRAELRPGLQIEFRSRVPAVDGPEARRLEARRTSVRHSRPLQRREGIAVGIAGGRRVPERQTPEDRVGRGVDVNGRAHVDGVREAAGGEATDEQRADGERGAQPIPKQWVSQVDLASE